MKDIEIIKRLNELAQEKTTLEKQTAERVEQIRAETQALTETIHRRAVGLDESKIALAEKVVMVGGKFERETGCLRRAMNCLAIGGGKMKTVAIAVKDYDRFRGQECDCEYGYGPKHGGHVFMVGLTPDARKRDLTEEECDAAIYYLVHFKDIQEAREKAAA